VNGWAHPAAGFARITRDSRLSRFRSLRFPYSRRRAIAERNTLKKCKSKEGCGAGWPERARLVKVRKNLNWHLRNRVSERLRQSQLPDADRRDGTGDDFRVGSHIFSSVARKDKCITSELPVKPFSEINLKSTRRSFARRPPHVRRVSVADGCVYASRSLMHSQVLGSAGCVKLGSEMGHLNINPERYATGRVWVPACLNCISYFTTARVCVDVIWKNDRINIDVS